MHSREQYLEEVRKEFVRTVKLGQNKLLNSNRRTRLIDTTSDPQRIIKPC